MKIKNMSKIIRNTKKNSNTGIKPGTLLVGKHDSPYMVTDNNVICSVLYNTNKKNDELYKKILKKYKIYCAYDENDTIVKVILSKRLNLTCYIGDIFSVRSKFFKKISEKEKTTYIYDKKTNVYTYSF